jgi:hypothetical protein
MGSHRGSDRREFDLALPDWNELPATSVRE